MEAGYERPVAHASRTLSTTVFDYSHLDKEALAVVFALKMSYQFLYSRHFKIYINNKALLGLLHPEKAMPLMASRSMQRCALPLLAYEYELLYRPGSENGNADGLSIFTRFGCPGVPTRHRGHCTLPTNDQHQEIKWGTAREPVLSQTLQFIPQG